MAGNSFGNIFKLSSFGESHGKALGGVIDGCPAGIELDLEIVNKELNRRRPGQSEIVTQRKEDDSVEILSGVFKGVTTGAPIGLIIRNKDQRSQDYSKIQEAPGKQRPEWWDKKKVFENSQILQMYFFGNHPN